VAGPRAWNNLPTRLHQTGSTVTFKRHRAEVCSLSTSIHQLVLFSFITSDNGGGVRFRLRARICLSVCLSVCVQVQDYSKTHAWIWMKCCVSTDVGTWTNWLTFEPDPDDSPDAGTGLLSPIAFALQRGILLRRESHTYWYWAPIEAATRGFEASKHRCRR